MIKHKVKRQLVFQFWFIFFITYSTLFYALFAFVNWHLNPGYWISESVWWMHKSRDIFASIMVIILFVSLIVTFMFWIKLKSEYGFYRKTHDYFNQIFLGVIVLIMPLVLVVTFVCTYFAYGISLWDFNAAHWSYEIREKIQNIILIPLFIASLYYILFSLLMLDCDFIFKSNAHKKNIVSEDKHLTSSILAYFVILVPTLLLTLYVVSALINWSLNPAYWQADIRAFFSWMFSIMIGIEITFSIIWCLCTKEVNSNVIRKIAQYHLIILTIFVITSLILYIGYVISNWTIYPSDWPFNDRIDLFLYAIKIPIYLIGLVVLFVVLKIGLLENFK